MGLCLGTPLAPSTTQNVTSSSEYNETVATTSMSRRSNWEEEVPKPKVFTLSEIKLATKNFRHEPIIGDGVFENVFKGWLNEKTLAPSKPEAGIMVTVKMLNSESEGGIKEWQTEANFLGKLSHPNLVKLLGYCCENKMMFLVYESMQNRSLGNRLFVGNMYAKPLPWSTRLQIAIGAARGLTFLHSSENNIIHRDFKASNILLDVNYNAKISDLSLARLGPTNGDSDVSTRVMGTYSYVAPEYMATGRLSSKCDVYSFGVVLLEMLTGLRAFDGNRPKDQQSLVGWARPLMGSKTKLRKIIDRKMYGQYPPNEVLQMAQIALRCLEGSPTKRPSMKEVVKALEGIEKPKQSKAASTHIM